MSSLGVQCALRDIRRCVCGRVGVSGRPRSRSDSGRRCLFLELGCGGRRASWASLLGNVS